MLRGLQWSWSCKMVVCMCSVRLLLDLLLLSVQLQVHLLACVLLLHPIHCLPMVHQCTCSFPPKGCALDGTFMQSRSSIIPWVTWFSYLLPQRLESPLVCHPSCDHWETHLCTFSGQWVLRDEVVGRHICVVSGLLKLATRDKLHVGHLIYGSWYFSWIPLVERCRIDLKIIRLSHVFMEIWIYLYYLTICQGRPTTKLPQLILNILL